MIDLSMLRLFEMCMDGKDNSHHNKIEEEFILIMSFILQKDEREIRKEIERNHDTRTAIDLLHKKIELEAQLYEVEKEEQKLIDKTGYVQVELD